MFYCFFITYSLTINLSACRVVALLLVLSNDRHYFQQNEGDFFVKVQWFDYAYTNELKIKDLSRVDWSSNAEEWFREA